MNKNIAIYILILLLFLTGFMFLLRENINYDEKLKLVEAYEQSQEKYLKNISELSANYNELDSKYNELYMDYINLKQNEQWQLFEATAYTSNECGFVTKIGLDLREDYSKYFNICAVDPNVIPLGSTLLVKFSNGEIKPYIACDTGLAIKGKIIDLYFNDTGEAFKFGRQRLEVKIIE